MQEKLRAILNAIWRFPCKSVVFLLIVCARYEGDLKMLTKSDPLPALYLILLGVAAMLAFFDRGLPLKFCLLLVIANMAVRDNYPFSHFPMYARFSDHTYYVFVADRDGQPLPIQSITSIRTSNIKKPYDKQLDRERKKLRKRKRELTAAQREAAGEDALAQIWRNSSPEARAKLAAHAPLQLYHVDIYMRDGQVDERPPERIAELELPPE